jgi:hypothetical protein
VNPDRKRQQLARRIVQRQQAELTASADPVMESLDHMRRQVRELRERDPDDPHGFHDMSERELVNWMGAGNARLGSVVFKHAELVLSMKQREAQGIGGTDEPTEARSLHPVHVAVLAVAVAVLFGAHAAKASWPLSAVIAFVTFICLVVGPSQRAIVRLLDRLGRIGG